MTLVVVGLAALAATLTYGLHRLREAGRVIDSRPWETWPLESDGIPEPPDDGGRIAYCVEHCGRRATHKRPLGMTGDGTPITELVCANHANGSLFKIEDEP